jgi:WD40 repeat protein
LLTSYFYDLSRPNLPADIKPLKVWDVDSGKELRALDFPVLGMAFLPDNKQALLELRSGRGLEVWDIVTSRRVRQIRNPQITLYVAQLFPDGKSVLSVTASGGLCVWDIGTGKELRTFGEPSPGISALALSPNGKLALTLYPPVSRTDICVKLWDVATGKEIRSFKRTDTEGWGGPLAFSRDGKLTVLSKYQVTPKGHKYERKDFLVLWDLASGKAIQEIPLLPGRYPVQVAFTPDSKRLLTGLEYGQLELWELSTGTVLWSVPTGPANGSRAQAEGRTIKPHLALHLFAFSPDASRALSAGGIDAIGPGVPELGQKWPSWLEAGKRHRSMFLEIWDGVNGALLRSLGGDKTK